MSSARSFLGPYRLLNVVHTGQISAIWQAIDDGTHEFVAVKTLLGEYQRQPEHLRYLRWEHFVGTKLDHERFVRVHEFGNVRGSAYLGMEWFASPNMKHWIRQGLESYAHMVPQIIRQSAEALVFMHDQGWVHRDVKPDNFMVTEEGEVKLIDLALAQRKAGALGRMLGRKSKVQGTKSYMSPEQIRGLPLDGRADLYSFACTVFELLGGRPPFTGNSPNELLMKHLKGTPPPLLSFNRNVTVEFADLIHRCLAKKLAARPESIAEFLSEAEGMRVYRRDPKPPVKVENTEG